MTYLKLKEKLTKYRLERGWNDQAPVDHIKSIIIEAAELLEHFQWDETSRIEGDEKTISNKNLEEIRDEIGDIGVYLFALCDVLECDFVDVVNNKLKKVIKKYPADKIKNKSRDGFYMKRKKQYRKNK